MAHAGDELVLRPNQLLEPLAGPGALGDVVGNADHARYLSPIPDRGKPSVEDGPADLYGGREGFTVESATYRGDHVRRISEQLERGAAHRLTGGQTEGA